MVSMYTRGMVYWVNIPKAYGDSVQIGRRPCIIISNNVGNALSDNVTIVPCTTQIEKKLDQPTHHLLKIFPQTESIALGENIITVSKKLCEQFIGILDEENMKDIDKIIRIALDLNETPVTFKKKEAPEQPKEATKNESTPSRLDSLDAQQAFLKDFDKYGVQYILTKYGITNASAAYQRKQYYKNKLTKLTK